MKSITIHGLDDELAQCIETRARAKGTSQNRFIKSLLAAALGVGGDEAAQRGQAFARLQGRWQPQDLAEFEQATADLRKVDPGDWP